MKTFKDKIPFNVRKAEAIKIRDKYPDRIPVIVEKSDKCTLIHDIDKQKYLVPRTLSCSQFLYIIRKINYIFFSTNFVNSTT